MFIREPRVAPERLAHLPIFPLPNAVLLPEGHLPLHVFEPRYRRLVADCMDGDRLLAVALLIGSSTTPTEGCACSAPGQDPLRRVAGVGEIEVHQELAEGRSLIILRGLMRVAITQELDVETPYRVFRAGQLADAPLAPGSPTLQDAVTVVRKLVVQLGKLIPDGAGQTLTEVCQRQADPARLADLVASAVLLDPAARQDFLEETDVLRRLEGAAEAVVRVIERIGSSGKLALN